MSLDLNEIKRLLNSPNVEDRKRVIVLIAKSGHTDLLPYLAAIYKTDSNEEVRRLALEAGRHLKAMQQQEQKWQGKPPREDAPDPSAPVRVAVSKADEQKSFELMDRALQLSLSGDVNKAKRLARQAFKVNANLEFDPYYKGMLGEIFGMRPDDAMEALAHSDNDKPKRKNDQLVDSDESWGAAIGDLIIYTLASATTVIVGFLLIIMLLQAPLDAMLRTLESDPEVAYAMAESGIGSLTQVVQLISIATIVPTIMGGLASGVSALINLLLVDFFYHLAAQFLLGGEGSFVRLIRKTTNFYTFVTVITFVAGMVVLYLILNSLANDWSAVEAAWRAGMDYEAQVSPEQLTWVVPLACAAPLFALFVLFRTAYLIGQAYDFGTGRGCLTIILGMMGMSFVGGAINAAVIGTIFGTLLNAF